MGVEARPRYHRNPRISEVPETIRGIRIEAYLGNQVPTGIVRHRRNLATDELPSCRKAERALCTSRPSSASRFATSRR